MFRTYCPINQHPVERIARIGLGAIALSAVFFGAKSWLGLIGIVPIITGIVGYCPLYTLLGFSTSRRDPSRV